MIDNLKDCDSYIQNVIVSNTLYLFQNGSEPGDSSIGRLLQECMTQFSNDDMALLESSVASNFEDALIIGSLSKLQQH